MRTRRVRICRTWMCKCREGQGWPRAASLNIIALQKIAKKGIFYNPATAVYSTVELNRFAVAYVLILTFPEIPSAYLSPATVGC